LQLDCRFLRGVSEREDFRQAYATYWVQTDDQTAYGKPVDGIILPVSPTTAVREGEFRYFAYSAIANLLDYPAAVFPVTRKGDVEFQTAVNNKSPLSEFDLAVPLSCKSIEFRTQHSILDRADLNTTDREEDAKGMSVCLQVMCTRLQEERVLAFARAIYDLLRAQ
jgi:amidase